MHPVDLMIVICIGNVVGWMTGIYVEGAARGLIGHVAVAMLGALLAGHAAQLLVPEFAKTALVLGGLTGAAALVYLLRIVKRA